MSDDLRALAENTLAECEAPHSTHAQKIGLLMCALRAAVEAERARCEKAAMDVLPDTDEHARSIRQSVFAAIRERKP